MDEDSAVQDALTSESVRAALKSLDPRYYDQHFMLQSPISHTDIPFGATSSSPGMSDIYHGSRTPTWYDLPPVSEVGFETGRTEANTLIGNKPYVYASTEPNVSKMLSEGEGRFGTYLKGEVPTESLRLGISTVPGAFGGDPRYPNYDPGKEEFIRSRGFDPKMAETEFLLTPENANRAFGFSPGDATVAPRSRVGPFDLGQTAAQQAEGARIPLSAALKGISGAVLNTGPKVGEYIGSAKDFLPGLKQKAITGAGTAARFLGPLSIPIDIWAANQWFGEDAPARGLAALASTVFPPALAVEAGLTVGASIQDAARQAGEYLTSPENPLPGIFPEGTPDLTGNVPLQQDIRAEDSTLTDRFGDYVASRNVYEDVDVLDTTEELREQAENIYDAYSPEQQSQSAQALIRSFTENTEVAPLVSREGDRRAAVEEALETYLPAAMGIYDQVDQFQEPLSDVQKGIMDLIDWDKYEEAGKAGEFGADFDYIPAQVSSGVGGDLPSAPITSSAWDTDKSEWAERQLLDAQIGASPTPTTTEDLDKWDVRSHINLLFGSGAETPPESWSDSKTKVRDAMMSIAETAQAIGAQGIVGSIGAMYKDRPPLEYDGTTVVLPPIPFLPGQSDVNRMAGIYREFDNEAEKWGKYTDNAPAEEAKIEIAKAQKEIIQVDKNTGIATGPIVESLKDLVNNEVIKEGRDAGLTQEQVYNSPNLVFDPSQLSATARLLTEGGKKSLTKNDLMELSTQVESFSAPGIEWTPPVKKEVEKAKPVKKKKSAAVKAAERDVSADKAAKERAERAKAAAKTESQRARAEQSRLEALSRQRAAEERARQAAQSAAQKAEADRIKRAQQSASAAALASARMESLRQVELMRKRQEEKLLQDKLADQMARYQTTGRWVGGL